MLGDNTNKIVFQKVKENILFSTAVLMIVGYEMIKGFENKSFNRKVTDAFLILGGRNVSAETELVRL